MRQWEELNRFSCVMAYAVCMYNIILAIYLFTSQKLMAKQRFQCGKYIKNYAAVECTPHIWVAYANRSRLLMPSSNIEQKPFECYSLFSRLELSRVSSLSKVNEKLSSTKWAEENERVFFSLACAILVDSYASSFASHRVTRLCTFARCMNLFVQVALKLRRISTQYTQYNERLEKQHQQRSHVVDNCFFVEN